MKKGDRHTVAIEELQSRYRFRRKIGSGGFCDVFHATHEDSGTEVAIKMMQARGSAGESDTDTELRAVRFRREMQLYSELNHPNIVKVIESGETDTGLMFIVFEYIPGRTLDVILRKEGAFPIQRAYALMLQILEGLTITHAKGIIHRDLKPENIMVVQTESTELVKILDFGVSKLASQKWNDKGCLTQTKEFLGTPLYAAPEQLRGDVITRKVDLFAWGLITLECLTGRYPYQSQNIPQVVQKQLSDTPVPMPTVLEEHRWGALLRWVLEKNPARRAGDSQAVLDRFRDLSLTGLSDQSGFLIDGTSAERYSGAGVVQRRPRRASAYPEELRQITVLCFSLRFVCNAEAEVQEERDIYDDLYCDTIDLYIAKAKELGGYVVGSLGDRIMVYFGFPDASDTDPRRGVRAALEFSSLTTKRGAVLANRHRISLSHQIALHTGIITVRAGSREKTPPMGMTTNLVGMLCSEAPLLPKYP